MVNPKLKNKENETMYNPYVRHEDINVRHCQVVYLRQLCGMSYAEIAEITGYAVSTCRKYGCIGVTETQVETLLEVFGGYDYPEMATDVEPIPQTLYRKFKDGRPAVAMEFMSGCGENLKGEQAVYFFKFFNEHALEFNKIGTSAVDVIARLRDEIGEYSKKFDIRRVEIHRICPCGNCPAEGAESALRAELCRHYPEAYRKNDRFFGVDIDPEVFDQVLNAYFA